MFIEIQEKAHCTGDIKIVNLQNYDIKRVSNGDFKATVKLLAFNAHPGYNILIDEFYEDFIYRIEKNSWKPIIRLKH